MHLTIPASITLHPFWSVVVAYWVYSAAVDNLPAPNGNLAYRWLYGFMHSIAGNLTTAFGSKIPGLPVQK